MTEHETATPYAPPATVTCHAAVPSWLLEIGWLASATLGLSLLTLTIFGSFAFNHREIVIFSFNDQAHLISLTTSVGLALCACLSQIAEKIIRWRHGGTLVFALIAASAISYLAWTSWPYLLFFDLSNILACYTAIALGPALVISAPVGRRHTRWVASVSFAMLGALALYVVFR